MKKTVNQIVWEREEVFRATCALLSALGFSPSFAEIAKATGLAKSVVRLRLLELEALGRLLVTPGRFRTIQISSKIESEPVEAS